MNMNNLLLSLTYLCGILALASAQDGAAPHSLLRGSTLLRHSETPKVTLSDWMSATKEYADLSTTSSVNDNKKESGVLPTEYATNGIELLRQSYQLSNQFLPDDNDPSDEYAVLSIEAVENEYVSQDSIASPEYVADEPVEPVKCPSPDEVDYKGTDADICMRIRFYCGEGFEYFGGDACGCGCKPVAV
jgi:hypothetical protein